MEQLKLTDKQKEILKRLDGVIQEAVETKIGFVYDLEDQTVNAYNASNANESYAGSLPENEDDCELNFYKNTLTHVCSKFLDYYDGRMQSYYLKSN